MSTPQFLADEDFRYAIVQATRRMEPALEFFRVQDLGLSGKHDSEVLEYAWANGLIVVSHDVNTMPKAAFDRLAHGKNLNGLLLVQQRRMTRLVADEIVLIWTASSAEEYVDQIVYLPQ